MRKKSHGSRILQFRAGDDLTIRELYDQIDGITQSDIGWFEGPSGAKMIADHLAGSNVEVKEQISGKWLLAAAVEGRVRVDPAVIDSLKTLDEIYVSSLDANTFVHKDEPVAVVRALLPRMQEETVNIANERIGDKKLNIDAQDRS